MCLFLQTRNTKDPNETLNLSEGTSGFIILFFKFFCRFQIKKYNVKSLKTETPPCRGPSVPASLLGVGVRGEKVSPGLALLVGEERRTGG